MKSRRFELHLPGLLKVLAEHLYSSKKVGVRELIQNAHDSCIRRKIEEHKPGFRPRITVSMNLRQRTLTIADNGSGMTESEITDYLATIGRGYTREMREQLSTTSPEEAAELIGQFGLGFLSAFLLADEVTVETRSMRGGPALRWQSRGDENYDLTESRASIDVGTTVTLRVKPAASFILDEHVLQDAIRNYADFLPVPIYLDGDSEPLNLMEAPWDADEPHDASLTFIQRVYQEREPLAVIPLRDGKVSLGHDTITLPLRGFLFVPSVSVASVREFGDLRVYIRRMFICDRQEDLLPPWARFVRGVIDCPVLQPTASREDIHQDDQFESVRQALEDQLSRGLRDLARRDPGRWKHLVRSHSDLIIGWAVKDMEFFEQVKDLVAVRTSRGLMTMSEYLDVSGGRLYYVTRELGSLQEQLLAEGRDVPAIDASWFSVEPFLEKYSATQGDIELVKMDGDTERLLRPAPAKALAPLAAFYREQGIACKVVSFDPKDVPALMIYPADAEILRDSQNAIETNDLPDSMMPLVKAFVDDKIDEREDWDGTLFLNAACPFLRDLAKHPSAEKVSPEALAAVLRLLYHQARLFCGRMLRPKDAIAAFRDLTASLKEIVS